jgi:hypothetical protein
MQQAAANEGTVSATADELHKSSGRSKQLDARQLAINK